MFTGGEFAFVAFGEAVARGVLPVPITNLLYLVVALSMALTPYLAALGGMLGQLLDQKDTKALQPKESETKELNDHVIILGYGRSGQLIAQVGSRTEWAGVDGGRLGLTGRGCSGQLITRKGCRWAASGLQNLPVFWGRWAGLQTLEPPRAAHRAGGGAEPIGWVWGKICQFCGA